MLNARSLDDVETQFTHGFRWRGISSPSSAPYHPVEYVELYLCRSRTLCECDLWFYFGQHNSVMKVCVDPNATAIGRIVWQHQTTPSSMHYWRGAYSIGLWWSFWSKMRRRYGLLLRPSPLKINTSLHKCLYLLGCGTTSDANYQPNQLRRTIQLICRLLSSRKSWLVDCQRWRFLWFSCLSPWKGGRNTAWYLCWQWCLCLQEQQHACQRTGTYWTSRSNHPNSRFNIMLTLIFLTQQLV